MENSPEQNNPTESSQNEEISLIDLFAVLLRYKKLIILLTVSTAAAVFFPVYFGKTLDLDPGFFKFQLFR